ncbi:MAG: TolC family protein [Magnetospirillum sp.]|nr:TolC family protein [Magnetospirillum sp.]
MRVLVRMAVAAFLAAPLMACSTSPEILDFLQLKKIVSEDRGATVVEQPPITEPLTLHEVMARVVAYNLDNRTRMMEEALAGSQVELARYEMLPVLAAQAGFTSRDNHPASTDSSFPSHARSTSYTYSQDRDRFTADVRLSWNILDFGVSYFQAKQTADRFLISQGNRKKLMIRVLQQTRTAYWRAAAAQRLRPELTEMLRDTHAALADVERAQSEQLRPPLASLQLRRALLEILGQLEALDRQLSMSELDLKQLMNLPPTATLRLKTPEDLPALPKFDRPTDDFELIALINSTDITEQVYQKRIERNESRKALARLLPGIEMFTSYNYDSNSYLFYDHWREAGAKATWNLMRILSAPSNLEVADARENVADMRRRAVNMAVLSRLHIAWWRYQDLTDQYDRARQMDALEREIAILSEAQQEADTGSKVEQVRAQATALRARLRFFEAYANAQDAYGTFLVGLGLDPLPPEWRKLNLADLSAALDAVLSEWEAGRLPPLPAEDDGTETP